MNHTIGGVIIQLTSRQSQIVDLVKEYQPISGEQIAVRLGFPRTTLRTDLSLLTHNGILEARPKVGYCFGKSTSYLGQAAMVREKTVGSVMSTPVAISVHSTIHTAIITLFTQDASSVFVIDEGILVGLVSRKDLLRHTIGGLDLNTTPVSLAMTRVPNIIYAQPQELVPVVAQRLLVHQVDSLPVVEPQMVDGREQLALVGRFTKTNIAHLFIDIITG